MHYVRIFSVSFFLFFNTSSLLWADDIWFLLPSKNQPVSGKMQIKIHPPSYDVPVRVWIESKRNDQIVWMGQLVSKYSYSIIVDTARFKQGSYEINAEYYLDHEEYDGSIDIWVNTP